MGKDTMVVPKGLRVETRPTGLVIRTGRRAHGMRAFLGFAGLFVVGTVCAGLPYLGLAVLGESLGPGGESVLAFAGLGSLLLGYGLPLAGLVYGQKPVAVEVTQHTLRVPGEEVPLGEIAAIRAVSDRPTSRLELVTRDGEVHAVTGLYDGEVAWLEGALAPLVERAGEGEGGGAEEVRRRVAALLERVSG